MPPPRTPTFSAGQLTAALKQVPASGWSPATTVEEHKVYDGYRVISLVERGERRLHADLFAFVLDVFSPVWSAWLSCVEPGGFVLPHIDAGPHRERWQVPIRPAGTMNGRPAEPGAAFRVEHWKPHSVTNSTPERRIHLVLDRDIVVNPTVTPSRIVEGEP